MWGASSRVLTAGGLALRALHGMLPFLQIHCL